MFQKKKTACDVFRKVWFSSMHNFKNEEDLPLGNEDCLSTEQNEKLLLCCITNKKQQIMGVKATAEK